MCVMAVRGRFGDKGGCIGWHARRPHLPLACWASHPCLPTQFNYPLLRCLLQTRLTSKLDRRWHRL